MSHGEKWNAHPAPQSASGRWLKRVAAASLAVSLWGAGGLAAAGQSSTVAITPFDAPSAAEAMGSGTVATAIDASGNVAGVYLDANKVVHSYIRSASGTITNIEVTASAGGANRKTVPIGFDTAGDLLGSYIDVNQVQHGFLRTVSGAISTIDAPDAGANRGNGTMPLYIDGAGDISGIYTDANGYTHGFIYLHSVAGSVSAVTEVEACPSLTGTTQPSGAVLTCGTRYVTVNAAGEAAGTYAGTTYNSINILNRDLGLRGVHGFIRSSSGAFTTIDVPSTSSVTVVATVVYALDASGDVGGAYVDSNKVTHGFVRSASGTFSTFDAPKAGTGAYQGTILFDFPFAFDAAGDLAGQYVDNANVAHGFVRAANGTITSYDAPGVEPFSKGVTKTFARRMAPRQKLNGGNTAELLGHGLLPLSQSPNTDSPFTFYGGTIGVGLDSAGDIAGIYSDSASTEHSFVRAADGTISTFDVLTTTSWPGAGTGAYQGSYAFALNANRQIAGTFVDANYAIHGFVAQLGAEATTVTLSANQNSSVYNEPVTFTANVVAVSATRVVPADGETVNFMNGTVKMGSATLSGGSATYTTTALPTAINPATGMQEADAITAVYGGDSTYAGSTSNTVNEVIDRASSTTALSSSANPSNSGQSVTFTATVSGQFGGTATGTVTFSNGSTSLGSPSLSGNAASLTTTALPAGTDTITAVYSGDSNFTGSTSNTVSQVVNAAATAPTVSLTGSPTTGLGYGATVTLTATASPNPGVAEGYSWTILDGTTKLVNGAMPNTTTGFVFTTPALTAGQHVFTAVYSSSVINAAGIAAYPTGTSNTVIVNVAQVTPAITWATPAAITYGTALGAAQLNANSKVAGTFSYTPPLGTVPAAGSQTLSVTFTPTDMTDYTTATAQVQLTVNGVAVPAPVLTSISPAFTNAGGAAFTLTVNGTGFINGSTVYWGSSALATTYVGATATGAAQLTAQVPASDIASAGVAAVTVQTPASSGTTGGTSTSNVLQFQVDTASGSTTPPTITTTTASVAPGSSASYPVTLPTAVTSVSATCLNLPAGAACSYSSTTKAVTITTSALTPAGTYPITVVFTESVTGAATGLILLPILLLPLLFLRRKQAARGIWLSASLALLLMVAATCSTGCAGSNSATTPPAHQVTSSSSVTLTVQ